MAKQEQTSSIKQKEYEKALADKWAKRAWWFAGSSNGIITLKEWMDFFKNAAIYALIFNYAVYPGPKYEAVDWGAWVWIGKAGICIGLIYIFGQFIALAALTWPQGNTKLEKFGLGLFVAVILSGILLGVLIYARATAK